MFTPTSSFVDPSASAEAANKELKYPPDTTSGLGISGQTMKRGKEVWRRSGLSSLWRSSEAGSTSSAPLPSSSTGSLRVDPQAVDSAASSLISQMKFRTQPLDTSSILHPTLTVHPEPISHNILVLSLSHISSAPPTLTNDELFTVLLRRLEPWVGEEAEGGYVLVVLADGNGDQSQNSNGKGKAKEQRKLPGIAWWVWKWKRLPRKYRKNLKRLYIVHPSLFTRTLLPLIIPFISPKSYSKLHPLPSILSLYHTYHVPLKGIDLTLSALEEEARVLREKPEIIPPSSSSPSRSDRGHGSNRPKLDRETSDSSLASWGYHAISFAINTAASYLPLPQFGLLNHGDLSPRDGLLGKRGYWSRNLEKLFDEDGGEVPQLLIDLRKVILAECVTTEGVFRRSSNSQLITPLIALLDLPTADQPNIPWTEIARDDPLLPPKILSRFLGQLNEPVVGSELYGIVRKVKSAQDIKTTFIPSLPPSSAILLTYLTHLLHHLSLLSGDTKMTPLNLAIVLASVLISGPDPIADTLMCLEPGKPVPVGLKTLIAANQNGATEGQEGVGGGTVVGLLEMWIRDWVAISSSSSSPSSMPTSTPSTSSGVAKEVGGSNDRSSPSAGSSLPCTCSWTRPKSSEGRRHSSTPASMGVATPTSDQGHLSS